MTDAENISVTYAGDLSRIAHRKGDKYVLKLDMDVRRDLAEAIHRQVSEFLGAEVLVITKGVSLQSVGSE